MHKLLEVGGGSNIIQELPSAENDPTQKRMNNKLLSESEARDKTNEVKTKLEKINLLIQYHANTLDEESSSNQLYKQLGIHLQHQGILLFTPENSCYSKKQS